MILRKSEIHTVDTQSPFVFYIDLVTRLSDADYRELLNRMLVDPANCWRKEWCIVPRVDWRLMYLLAQTEKYSLQRHPPQWIPMDDTSSKRRWTPWCVDRGLSPIKFFWTLNLVSRGSSSCMVLGYGMRSVLSIKQQIKLCNTVCIVCLH